jgi:hypothetical protein
MTCKPVNTIKDVEVVFVSSKNQRLYFKVDSTYSKTLEFKQSQYIKDGDVFVYYEFFWDGNDGTKMLTLKQTDKKFIKGHKYIIDLDISEHYDHRCHHNTRYDAEIRNVKGEEDTVDFID